MPLSPLPPQPHSPLSAGHRSAPPDPALAPADQADTPSMLTLRNTLDTAMVQADIKVFERKLQRLSISLGLTSAAGRALETGLASSGGYLAAQGHLNDDMLSRGVGYTLMVVGAGLAGIHSRVFECACRRQIKEQARYSQGLENAKKNLEDLESALPASGTQESGEKSNLLPPPRRSRPPIDTSDCVFVFPDPRQSEATTSTVTIHISEPESKTPTPDWKTEASS